MPDCQSPECDKRMSKMETALADGEEQFQTICSEIRGLKANQKNIGEDVREIKQALCGNPQFAQKGLIEMHKDHDTRLARLEERTGTVEQVTRPVVNFKEWVMAGIGTVIVALITAIITTAFLGGFGK